MSSPVANDPILAELASVLKEQNKAEYEIFKYSNKLMAPIYEKRREYTRQVPKFWPTVFDTCELLADFLIFEDLELLDHLTDLYIERDEANPKNLSITFEFEPNDHLESLVLTKVLKYIEPTEEQRKAAELTDNAEPEGKYMSEPVPIKWKKHKNLTRPGPTTQGTSFFKFFDFVGSGAGDYKHGEDIALVLSEEIYPHALKFYVDAGNDIEEEYDISEEDDDEDEDDVDDSDHEHQDEPPRKKIRA